MLLFDLASHYPKSVHNISSLALGLPNQVRISLAQNFGHIAAALDHHHSKSSSRMGIELRDYQPGDKLQAVSVQNWLRTNRLESRIQESPGRQFILVALHLYENMNFESQNINKVQVALACAALIERLHLNHSHSVSFVVFSDANIEHAVAHKPALERYQDVYILSDFLHRNPEEGLDIESLNTIATRTKTHLIAVRDPLEWTEASLPEFDLHPYRVGGAEFDAATTTFGDSYREKLKQHFLQMREQASERKIDLTLMTGTNTIETFCTHLALTHSAQKGRHL